MDTATTSSSGHVIEFNQNTGSGLIQEETTKRILLVQFTSFKDRSKRYLTNDNKFIGELFDFDIILKQKKNDDDDNGIDTFEAVNVKHRVLKCNVEGCPRITAFTNVKALEDHIHIRHTSKNTKEETSPAPLVVAKTSKKKRRSRPQPILITLASQSTAAAIGRFIGKQGINLKRLEQQNQVKLQLLNTEKVSNPLQILIKLNVGVTVDIKSLSNKLKSAWNCCVREQQGYEEMREERLRLKQSSEKRITPQFEKDSRYRDNSKFPHASQLKQQESIRRRRYRQTESSVRVQERHSSLNQEGHRSAATCDSVYRLKSIFNCLQSKKIKKSMKEKQWLVNEQLYDLECLSVSS